MVSVFVPVVLAVADTVAVSVIELVADSVVTVPVSEAELALV